MEAGESRFQVQDKFNSEYDGNVRLHGGNDRTGVRQDYVVHLIKSEPI